MVQHIQLIKPVIKYFNILQTLLQDFLIIPSLEKGVRVSLTED
jgi:hypothetical protein